MVTGIAASVVHFSRSSRERSASDAGDGGARGTTLTRVAALRDLSRNRERCTWLILQ
jgi:hypothetical protein